MPCVPRSDLQPTVRADQPDLAGARAKTIAIGFDMVYWTSPDSYLVALDARTGEVRWSNY